jgi:tetratricopeptide (TPR) repeat protein
MELGSYFLFLQEQIKDTRRSLGDFSQAIEHHTQDLAIAKEVGDRSGEGGAYGNLGNAYDSLVDFSQAIKHHTKHLSIAKEVSDRAGEGKAYGGLGNAHFLLLDFSQAIEYHTKHLAIAREVGDRAGESGAYGNLGNAHFLLGDFSQAIEYHTQQLSIGKEVVDRAGRARCSTTSVFRSQRMAICRPPRAPSCLAVLQRVERDLGAHDDRRVSLFEQQQNTYRVLQGVLLGLEQPRWALGVSSQAKARALLYHLTEDNLGHSNEDHASMTATNGAYKNVCEAWWREVQQDSQAEGDAGAERIVEYSFLSGDRLDIWVLKGTGGLLGSTTVSTRPARASKAKSNDRMFGCRRMFQCPRKFNQEPKFESTFPWTQVRRW